MIDYNRRVLVLPGYASSKKPELASASRGSVSTTETATSIAMFADYTRRKDIKLLQQTKNKLLTR